MPKRTRSHQLEDMSRNRLHHLFTKVGWTVEDLAKDYGEDILVRIFEKGEATQLSFFVQAKATDNFSRYLNKSSDLIRYPISKEHTSLWSRFHEPVILTLWDSRSDITYWTCAQDALDHTEGTPDRKRTKKVRIPIPCANILNSGAARRIRNIAQARHKRLEREVEGAKILIDLLESKLGVKVEYSASGVLIVTWPTNEIEMTFFGKTADLLDRIAKHRGISAQETLRAAMKSLYRDVMEHTKSGMYPVKNEENGKRELRRMSDHELHRYMRAELEEIDAS